MSDWKILEKLQPMLTGDELIEKMKVSPSYEEEIRDASTAEKLMNLNNIYSFYLPSEMSVEIYTKLYLAMIRSLQKKESRLAMEQRNLNGYLLHEKQENENFGGIIGGADCFSFLGASGIGKSCAINRAVKVMNGEQIIELDRPYCKLIPVIDVQCPFDCSPKTLLLTVAKKIDVALDTNYCEALIKSRAPVNLMILSVSQMLMNHVAVLIIDEVQNVVFHKAGQQLISLLTELINMSGISISLVGTPEVEPFFEKADYLARRTIGLRFERCAYDKYFFSFCRELWKYQYVNNKCELDDGMIHYLYEHSNGTLSHVVYLFHAAQELTILDGREVIDIEALEKAYQRMRLLHIHIQPEMEMKPAKRKREKSISNDGTRVEDKIAVKKNAIVKDQIVPWTFIELLNESKKKQRPLLESLLTRISITEIEV